MILKDDTINIVRANSLPSFFFDRSIQSTSISKNTIVTIKKNNLIPLSLNTTVDNSKIVPLPTVVDSDISQTPYSNHELPVFDLPIIPTIKVYSIISTRTIGENTMNNKKGNNILSSKIIFSSTTHNINLVIIFNNPFIFNNSAPNQIITTKYNHPPNQPLSLNITVDNSKLSPIPIVANSDKFQTPHYNHELTFFDLPIIPKIKVYSITSTCTTNENIMRNEKIKNTLSS